MKRGYFVLRITNNEAINTQMAIKKIFSFIDKYHLSGRRNTYGKKESK